MKKQRTAFSLARFTRSFPRNLPSRIAAIAMAMGLVLPAHALQSLDDSEMGDITGEGIAIALDDISVRFNGADNVADTGYIRFIPVGPLSQTIVDFNNNVGGVNPNGVKFGKADIYLYGLAISANDNLPNTRFSGNPVDIGSAANPFLIRVGSATLNSGAAGSVYNFDGTNTSISYLNVEAPLLDRLNDPYNLKIGTWLDALVRDPSKAEGAVGEFDLGGSGRANRLRMQAVINGISLNGSLIRLFSTPNKAVEAGLSGSYNNTLGLATTVRLNTQKDPTTVKGYTYSESTTTTQTAATTGTVSGWTTVHGGWYTALNPSTTGTTAQQAPSAGGCGNNLAGSAANYANAGASGCQFIVQKRTRTSDSRTFNVSKTGTYSGTASSDLMGHMLRLSTQECGSGNPNGCTTAGANSGLLNTPALNGGAAPSFAGGDGLYLFSPNINLVMGTLWQPLTFGVAADRRNLVIELARIPNVANVYNQVYTDYAGTNAALKGGTCNIYWCGDNNKNATHSSISIGTTTAWSGGASSAANFGALNILTASTANDATGVYWGAPGTGTATATSNITTTSGTLTEVRYMQRFLSATTYTSWVQNVRSCTVFVCGDTTVQSSTQGTRTEWWYMDSTGVPQPWNSTGFTNRDASSCTPGAVFSGSSTCTSGTQNQVLWGSAANSNWSVDNPAGYWQSSGNGLVDELITAANGVTGINVGLNTLANQAPTPSAASVAVNIPGVGANLGSAVIDGLLIQHLKFTTKGL